MLVIKSTFDKELLNDSRKNRGIFLIETRSDESDAQGTLEEHGFESRTAREDVADAVNQQPPSE